MTRELRPAIFQDQAPRGRGWLAENTPEMDSSGAKEPQELAVAQVLALSLLYGRTWAACIPNYTPSVDSLGSLQVLNYNDLRPEDNNKNTAAVIAYRKQSHPGAKATCSTIGEGLFTIHESLDSRSLKELQYQLDYLVFNGDLPAHGSLWVKSRSDGEDCVAYSYDKQKLNSVPCHTELPVLCTSTPPPTTEDHKQLEGYSKVSVNADSYILTGYRDARSFRFLGIPFADPPVDKLRFMPPQPYSGSKTLETTSFGKSCIQESGDDDDLQYSEDCLYVNVYTPVLPGNEPSAAVRHRPVAVYLYGGAFVSGSSSNSEYDGGDFVSRNDVVIVTFNYRLGPLGFLASDSLLSGSQGIKDQVLALQWVKQHIAAFGGDPEKVTIFGQSAGAQSVVALLSSSAVKGLFTGAISESDPLSLPWFTRDVYADFITPYVASDVGCNDTKTEKELVACLQSVPAAKFPQVDTSDIASAVNKGYLHSSALVAGIEIYLPVVDDTNSGVIDGQFHALIAEDKLPNRVPTVFTVVKDEAASWLNIVPELGSSQANLDAALSIAYPPGLASEMVDSGVFLVDSSNPDGVRVAVANFLTKSEWICPHAYLLDQASDAEIFPVIYEGLFTRGYTSNSSSTPELCLPNDVYNATCHGADIIPVWGTMNVLTGQRYNDADGLSHSQVMNDVYGAFLRTHDPNPDVDMLKIRGPAYSTTYGIFAKDGYEIRKYDSINQFGFPPTHVDGPLSARQCEVFESYGFTFDRASIEKS